MSLLSIGVERADRETVVTVAGELDMASVDELRAVVLAEFDSAERDAVVLDTAGLTFLDSTGLGCWVELHNAAGERGKQLRIVNLPRSLHRIVTIGGLADMLGLEGAPPAQ